MDIALNKEKYPKVDSTKYENLTGIVEGDRYKPTVGLCAIMTPFGVGHFSGDDNELSAKRKPVYIDEWAKM